VGTKQNEVFLRVGEVAKRVGKTVRALHLYEELDLITPAQRTVGGFRLYRADVVDRINWLTKLQAIGFSLSEIQGFVKEFEAAQSGRVATTRVRDEFRRKLEEVRLQIAQLQLIENDLVESIEYLASCHSCSESFLPAECGVCAHQGHDISEAPDLFSSLARGVTGRAAKLTKLTVVKADD